MGDELKSVSFSQNWRGTDEDFRRILDIQNVAHIDLNGAAFSEAPWQCLSDIKSLAFLDVTNTLVPESILKKIKINNPGIDIYDLHEHLVELDFSKVDENTLEALETLKQVDKQIHK